MTEAEWLASDDPARMLAWITCAGPSGDGGRDLERWEQRPSDRKLRLFACAWWRSIETHSLAHEEVALAVELHGAYRGPCGNLADADSLLRNCLEIGAETRRHLAQGAALLRDIVGNPWRPLPFSRMNGLLYPRAKVGEPLTEMIYPVPWLTPAVLAIARRAYDERDFDALPVLADALEDAGCDSEDLLRHLRGQERCPNCVPWPEAKNWVTGHLPGGVGGQYWLPCGDCDATGWVPLRGPHVRGCWALDLILG